MGKLLHSIAVLSVLACCGAAPVFAQGYNGVIPDNTASENGKAENTFGGALAPSHKSNAAKPQEPEGYRGVIPGRVAPPPKAVTPPAEEDTAATARDASTTKRARKQAQPKVSTPNPGMTFRQGYKPHKQLTAEDLKQIAAMTGVEVRLDNLPENLASAIHMPAHVYPIVSLPAVRVDGMLPSERIAKQTIDRSMKQVEDASALSPEARRKAVDNAVATLSNLARSARVQRDIPKEIYEAMGAPSIYIEESREGSAKAAERLEAAIQALQKMQ